MRKFLYLLILATVFLVAGSVGISFRQRTEAGSLRLVPALALVSDLEVSFSAEGEKGFIKAVVADATGDAWILTSVPRALSRVRDATEPKETVPLPEGDWKANCLATDGSATLYLADRNHLIRFRLAEREWDVLVWPTFSDLERICALSCDATGNLYVADRKLKQIVVLGNNGEKKRVAAEAEEFQNLGSLAIGPKGEIVCGIRKKIQVRARDGTMLREWKQKARLAASGRQPWLTVDQEGFIYAVNPDLPEFEVYDLEGNRLHLWKRSSARGIRMQDQAGISISPGGHLLIGHSRSRVARFQVEWKPEDEVFPVIPDRKEGPNLLLVALDTTRPDHLGCYGYHRDTCPVLDTIAAQGVRFTNAICQAPDTCASHASMMTSLHPYAHRARNAGYFLREEFTTLAEVARAAGYRTGAFVSGTTLTSYNSWLHQGFQVYENFDSIRNGAHTNEGTRRRANLTTDFAIEWLREQQGKRIFLWAHYFDPHTPYLPPEAYRGMFPYDESDPRNREKRKVYWGTYPWGDLVACYDAEIRFMDTEIGRLMAALDELGFAEDLFAIFVGDHGELLGEHGGWCTHSKSVFDEEIRIPFIVFDSNRERTKRAQVRGERVETIDILPTMAEAAGIEVPAEARGTSLLPWLKGEKRSWPRPFTWSQVCNQGFGSPSAYYAVRTLDWKYYGNTFNNGYRLFHLGSDPGERKNLSADPDRILESLGMGEDFFPEGLRRHAGKMVLYSISPGLEQLDELYRYPRQEVHRRFVEIYDQGIEWSGDDLDDVSMVEEEAPDEERARQLKALGYLGR